MELSKRTIARLRATGGVASGDLAEAVKAAQRVLGVTAGGVAGPMTLAALWRHRPPTPAEVVAAALAASRQPTNCAYQLGTGGYIWFPDHGPGAPSILRSDCSGFAAWCLGLPRDRADDVLGGPKWVETTQLYLDATGARHFVSAVPLADAQPGDLLVYPDPGPGRQGHVGVVVDVKPATGPRPARLLTVDCGKRRPMEKKPKVMTAIAYEDMTERWWRKGAIAARPVWYGWPSCV